jgi:hypothetical protein
VLYVVVGTREVYAEAALRSAGSLKRVMPDIPIAVATNRAISGPFDHHVPIESDDGYQAKILGMLKTPFERTVMLDVDTYVLADLSEMFELLDRFDMALAHATNRVTLCLEDVPASFPEFNTGVVGYRSAPIVTHVLKEWLLEYARLAASEPPSKDQPSFRRVAYRTPDLRLATLTPEFNQRFEMAGFFNLSVRVLHGWASEAVYEQVAEAMRTAPERWDYGAVFAGRRVFDGSGKQVDKFTSPWRRLRRAKALLRRSC